MKYVQLRTQYFVNNSEKFHNNLDSALENIKFLATALIPSPLVSQLRQTNQSQIALYSFVSHFFVAYIYVCFPLYALIN